MTHSIDHENDASDWRALAIAWGALIVALMVGTLPLLRVLDLIVFRVLFVLTVGLAGVLLTMLCRALWHRLSWQRVMAVAGITAYGLAVLCTAASTAGDDRYGHTPPIDFQWSQAMAGSPFAWFVLVAWCSALLALRHRRAMETERRRALAAEALARDAELRALRYQINPHFLFNTLNAVSTLIVEGRASDARTMLARLGDYFRATLVGDAEPLTLLADELQLTTQYLAIEQIRFGDRLAVDVDVSASALPARVPHLLLQPLVENAIRHGIAPLRGGGRLEIHAERIDSHIVIAVVNDAASGLQPAKTGIGLANTAARLRQHYGDDQTLEHRATNGRFVVRIRLPFQ